MTSRVGHTPWCGAANLALAVALVAGCSSGSAGAPATSAGSGVTGPSAAGSAGSGTGSGTGSVAGTVPLPSGSGSGAATPSATGLPGEPYDRGPKAGAVLAVSGVAADHTLALRARPGIDQQTVAALPSLTQGLVATGRARTVASAVWFELRFGAQTGWSSSRYLIWLAGSTDITATVVAALGPRAGAETMLDLGRAVARSRVPKATDSEIVVTGGPTVGASGEITVDVATAGDDAVAGQRLRVVAKPVTEGFTLTSVELTQLCSRGVSSGRCV